jgi:hypothetical protein
LQGKFLNNKMTSSGVVMTILGIFAAMLGVAAFANQSVLCLVNPGGFPCIMRYQVALLAHSIHRALG